MINLNFIKEVIAGSLLTVCILASAFENCLAISDTDLEPAVWSLQRIGEPIASGISEYTYGLAISPDLKRIATLGENLAIWNSATGEKVSESSQLIGKVVAWAPDNQVLASGTMNGRIVLIDSQTNRILWQKTVGKKAIAALAFSPNSKLIAVSSEDKHTIHVYTSSGKLLCETRPVHQAQITSLAFAEAGETLISASRDSSIRSWNPSSCEDKYQAITSRNGEFLHLALHPNGRIVAVAGREGPTKNDPFGGIEFWDITKRETVAPPQKGFAGTYGISRLLFSEDGDRLLVANRSGHVTLINWKTGHMVARGVAEHHDVIVWNTDFSANQNLIVTSGKDGVLGIWKAKILSGNQSPLAISDSKKYHLDGPIAKLNDDGRYAYFAKGNEFFVKSNLSDKITSSVQFKVPVTDFIVSQDGRWLAASTRGQIELWKLPEARQVARWKIRGRAVFSFNPSGTQLAYVIQDRSKEYIIRLIDCDSATIIGEHRMGWRNADPQVHKLLFNPSGDRLYAMTGSGDIYRFALPKLQILGKPWSSLTRYGSISISQDGHRLAVSRNMGSQDTIQIVILDSVTGEQLSPTPIITTLKRFSAIAFCADGNYLVAMDPSGVLSLWHIGTGQRLATLSTGRHSRLHKLSFSPDASQLYACEYGTNSGTNCQSWRLSINISNVNASPAVAAAKADLSLSAGMRSPIRISSLAQSIDLQSTKVLIERDADLFFHSSDGATHVLHQPGRSKNPAQGIFYQDSVISSDGRWITVPLEYPQLAIYSFQTGDLINVLESDGVHTFLSNGMLAANHRNKGVQLFDHASGELLNKENYPQLGYLYAMVAATEHPALIVAPAKGSLQYGQVVGSEIRFREITDISHGPTTALVISPDERLFASGRLDGKIQLYDLQSAKPKGEAWPGHGEGVTSMAINSDSRLLLSGYADGSIRLWDIKTGRPMTKALIAHSGPISGLIFDDQNSQVISIGNDHKIQYWSISEIDTKQDL
jgi:WD40 repeat protein